MPGCRLRSRLFSRDTGKGNPGPERGGGELEPTRFEPRGFPSLRACGLALCERFDPLRLGRQPVLARGGHRPTGVGLSHRESVDQELVVETPPGGLDLAFPSLNLRSAFHARKLPGNQDVGLPDRPTGILPHGAQLGIAERPGLEHSGLGAPHGLGALANGRVRLVEDRQELGLGNDRSVLRPTGDGEEASKEANQAETMHADSFPRPGSGHESHPGPRPWIRAAARSETGTGAAAVRVGTPPRRAFPRRASGTAKKAPQAPPPLRDQAAPPPLPSPA